MMTLEEAIKHCKDVAVSCTNKECALEHFQLLKWLQEYKSMLEKDSENKQLLSLKAEPSSERKPADSYCQENCKGFQEIGKCFADVVAEIKWLIQANDLYLKTTSESEDEEMRFQKVCACNVLNYLLHFLDSLEVKDDSLEKFKSLQHISRDLSSTLQDWGYTPNLYHFDGSWHVDWIHCEEGDSIEEFNADTPEEAINKAYNWFHSTFCNS